jgi:hypothetical protein
MMEDIANVGSALKRCLTIWVAARDLKLKLKDLREGWLFGAISTIAV